MSSAEFTDWIAYARIEPFGYEMENWRTGVVASTVANVAPRRPGTPALKPVDFFPSQATKHEQPKYTSADAQIALFKALAGKG